MVRGWIAIFTLSLAVVAIDTPAQGGWYEFWHCVHLDWHRNNAWPQPFNLHDRKACCAPFASMIEKGWLLQNTIGDHHFDRETQQLTEAGMLKLRWILTENPVDRRTVVVVRGFTDETTAIRTDSVQQVAARLMPHGALPEVRLTDVQVRGWSADYVDAIERKARSLMKDPVLPAMDASTGSGS